MAESPIAAVANESRAAGRSVITAIDALLGGFVEILAATLVALEIAILFGGVLARYVFNHPLVWSDELASILFLWLAMLGAVIAFRRDEHMRMTAAVGSLPAPTRATFDLLATCAALAFLLLIAWPAYEYAQEETFITTPALGLNNAWRAAALPSGIVLMAAFAALRVGRAGSLRSVAIAAGTVAILVALFWLAAPLFRQLGNLNLLIFFVGVVAATVFAGVPIAFAFGLAIFGYLALTTHTPLMVLIGRMDEGMSHLILLAVPLFVFLGLLIEMTGMARAMVAFLANLLGHVRGGLHYVLVAAMYLVSGISGAKAADMAAVAPVLFPEMKARGAKPGSRRAAGRDRRANRDHSAEPGPHHHRIGDRRVDRRAVHRRAVARRGAGDFALLCRASALSPGKSRRREARNGAADRPLLCDRTAGAGAAVSDPRRRGRRRRHRD